VRCLTKYLLPVVLLGSLLAGIFDSSSAFALGSAPRVQLRVGAQHQTGGVVWEEWTDRAGPNSCVTGSGDGPGTFPTALQVAPDEYRPRFVVRTPLKPRRVELTAWRAVNGSGQPVGDETQLGVRLKPLRGRHGRINAWRVLFHIAPPPDYYMRLYVRWRPHHLCGGPRHLLWLYHVAAGH
jgi:hypothetical protein